MKNLFPDLLPSEIYQIEYSSPQDVYERALLVRSKLGKESLISLRKDIAIKYCMALLSNTCIVEIILNAGSQNYTSSIPKIEQIYYFYHRGKLSTMGETFWLDYHWFYAPVKEFLAKFNFSGLPINKQVAFVGGRDNFTHGCIDYAASVLWNFDLGLTSMPYYFGTSTELQDYIFRELKINQNDLKADEVESTYIQLSEKISVRLTYVQNLFVMRHGSIYKTIELLRNRLQSQLSFDDENLLSSGSCQIALVRDNNDRVKNNSYCASLLGSHDFQLVSSIYKLSFHERLNLLRNCKDLVVPPGSDNVNAFLFSPESCNIVQMQCLPSLDSQYEMRLFNHSGMRYCLPFLYRFSFWIPDRKFSLNSGEWLSYTPMPSISSLL